jgi:type I restriction enzyme S subunit
MQRLLTGQVRFPGFADDWKDVKLEDVAKINPLKTANITDEMQVSFVGMADVSEEAKLINQTTKRCAEVKNGFTPFINDDILVAKITPCFENGKGALAQNLKNGLGFGSTEFHVIRATPEKANVHFLYYHTITHQFRERGKSTMTGSAGQKRVPAEFVTSFKIGLPSLSEQSKIVDVLVTCDQELALHQQKLAALRRQKQGLMQQLLTGRVRVAG